METLKLNFQIGEQTFEKEMEVSQDQIKNAIASKVYRTAQVLKNSYNANLTDRAKLEKYLQSNEIDTLRLATDAGYKKEIMSQANKLELDREPEKKQEQDFLDQAINKVLSGKGQND